MTLHVPNYPINTPTVTMLNEEKFHGYIGHLAILNNGKTVKILGGKGQFLYVKDVDGMVKECDRNELNYVFDLI
jgi:hypothetical protein